MAEQPSDEQVIRHFSGNEPDPRVDQLVGKLMSPPGGTHEHEAGERVDELENRYTGETEWAWCASCIDETLHGWVRDPASPRPELVCGECGN